MFRFTTELTKIFFHKGTTATPETVAQRAVISEIVSMVKTLPSSIPTFEYLLQDIDSGVRNAYNAANISTVQRAQFEHSMLVDASIPDVLMPVVTHLLTSSLGKIQDKIDMVRLTFADTEWLGLSHPVPEMVASQASTDIAPNRQPLLAIQRKWDVLRKTPLRQGMKLRSCRRCGSMMEDINSTEGTRVPWIWTGQKMCVCLGYWMLI